MNLGDKEEILGLNSTVPRDGLPLVTPFAVLIGDAPPGDEVAQLAASPHEWGCIGSTAEFIRRIH